MPGKEKRVASAVYVASTVPISILNKMIPSWGVTNIILAASSLLAPYEHLKAKHSGINIVVAPKNFLFQFIYLAYSLLRDRANKKPIIFFHECCWPVLDILINIIRPAGYHYPLVKMTAGFEVVSFNLAPPGRMKLFLLLTSLRRWFIVYRQPAPGNVGGYWFFFSFKQYPDCINVHSEEESRKLLANVDNNLQLTKSNKILMLAGRSAFPDKVVIEAFTSIINFATDCGFECFIKDHPNSEFRLNFEHSKAVVIDPTLPVELLDDNFCLAIAVSSIGLLHFGDRAISIIYLLNGITNRDRDSQVAFLMDIGCDVKIRFIESMDGLNNTLTQLSHCCSATGARDRIGNSA